MKGQSLEMGAFNAVFWRYVLGVAMMVPIYRPWRLRPPSGVVLRLHLWRSLAIALMVVLLFWGLARVPLAFGIGLSFVAPILALLMAAVFFGEKVRRGVYAASGIALAGVLVSVFGGGSRSAEMNNGVIALLVASVLYAVNIVLQRRQAQLAPALEIAFYQNVMVLCCLCVPAPWWVTLPATSMQWGIAALCAVVAIIAVMLLAMAYSRTETRVLVIVEYTAFIWAALFGWWLFAEIPTLHTMVGTALIILGCLWSHFGNAESRGRQNE